MQKTKMYCIFAKDSVDKLGGNRGKLASMAGHAYLHSWWDAMKINELNNDAYIQATDYYNSEKAYKITLIVDTVEQLKDLQYYYKDICGTSLVIDSAITVFNEPTIVCLGIGPICEDKIDDNLKQLKVFI